MKDYTETVRVEFDPNVISYGRLLGVFWDSHIATANNFSRQYRNAVFYRSEEQRLAAEKTKRELESLKDRPVYTAIEPAGDFYPAEDYHQKFYLRRDEQLLAELQRFYPDPEALAASTAAARLNGYLACQGEPDQLEKEIGQLGLSPAGQRSLVEFVKNGCRGFAGVRCALPPLDN